MKKALVLVIALFLSPSVAFADRIYTSGAELNSMTAGVECDTVSGAAMTVQTTTVRSGTYAYKVSGLSSGTRSGCFKGAVPGFNAHIRTYFKVDTLPSAENAIFFWGTSISSMSYPVTLDNTGVLRVRDGSSGTIRCTSSALSTGQWYRLEFLLTSAGATDAIDAKIDGTEWCTDGQGNQAGITGIFWGGNGRAEAQTTGVWTFDDLAINNNSGTTQNAYPGAGSVIHLYPNGDGDFEEGGQSTCTGSATAFENVDETPTPNDATDCWELITDSSTSSTSADRLDVNVQDFTETADSITLVQVGVRAKPETNASDSFVPRIKSQASGNTVEGTTAAITGTAWVTNDDTATTKNYKLTSYTDPQAGGSWTDALLDSMQIGIRAPDGAPDLMATSIWAVVEYVPGTPPAATPSSDTDMGIWLE